MEHTGRASKTSVRISRASVRKPMTDAEKFCALLKSLGYAIPSHTKPEHYEYLIQNDDIATFFKNLNKKIQPKNILDTADLKRFDDLVQDGAALFGTELETAIARIKFQELEAARNTQRVIDQHKAYDDSIEEKQKELERLQAVHNGYTEALQTKEGEEKYIDAKETFLKSQSEHLKAYLQTKQKELLDILDELNKFLKTVRNTTTMGQSRTNFADRDWRPLLATEETLVKVINLMESEFLQNIVDNVNSGDYGIGSDIGDSAGRIQQNMQDLDRLKHVIVYHNLREVQLNLEMAAVSNVIEKISAVRDEINMLASVSPLVQRGMLAEVREQNRMLSELQRKETQILIQREREERDNKLSSQCREILDRQFYVKRKLRKFHTFIMKALVHQRVRLDTTRELIRAEKFSDSNIAENFEQFNNFMFRRFEREEMLLQELLDSAKEDTTSEVSDYFDRSILSTGSDSNTLPLQSFQSLLANESKRQKEKIKELEQCQIEMNNQAKNYRLHLQMLQQLYNEIVKADTHATPQQQQLSTLLRSVDEKRQSINSLNQNKDKIVKESIEKKKEAVLRAQEILRKRKSDSTSSTETKGLALAPVTDH